MLRPMNTPRPSLRHHRNSLRRHRRSMPHRHHRAPAPEEDAITQIERLGALKAQGLLTEEEFAAQKAKLLGM